MIPSTRRPSPAHPAMLRAAQTTAVVYGAGVGVMAALFVAVLAKDGWRFPVGYTWRDPVRPILGWPWRAPAHIWRNR